MTKTIVSNIPKIMTEST